MIFATTCTYRGSIMRLGILFPVAIFIVAVVFLGWFFVGGYAAPGGAYYYAYCRHRRPGGDAIGLVVNPGIFAPLFGKDCRIISSTQ